jgi:hypothetical protein
MSADGAFIFASGDYAKLPETAAIGPAPTLPEPTKTLIPTVSRPQRGGPMARSRRRRAGLQ